MTIETTTISTDEAAKLLAELHATRHLYEITKAAYNAKVEALPEYHVMNATSKALAALDDKVRKVFAGQAVMETPFGKIGYQTRETVVYDPEAVRDLVPRYAEDVIKVKPAVETVDRAGLERMVKQGMKSGSLPENMLERLRERAMVAVSHAFVSEYKPVEPGSEAVETQPADDDAAPF